MMTPPPRYQRSSCVSAIMAMMVKKLSIVSLVFLSVASQEQEYGVDSSFPMHHNLVNGDDINPLGNSQRLATYKEFLSGCKDYYHAHYDIDTADRCDWNEDERIARNLKQPREMRNFTKTGFAKMAAPAEVTRLAHDFFQVGELAEELWPKGNTYVNHWEFSTSMMEMPQDLEDRIAELVRPVLEKWTGQPQAVTSVYGVRIYQDGTILAPHVNRLPLVSSCIINVAQDVDEEWPLEVIGHDGKAHNVTSQPGEIILYESHSIIHGRPFPLKGRFYANLFVHFEPHGYTQQHLEQGSQWVDTARSAHSDSTQEYDDDDDVAYEDQNTKEPTDEELYRRAEAKLLRMQKLQEAKKGKQKKKSAANGIPDYVDKDMEDRWRQNFVYKLDKKLPSTIDSATGPSTGRVIKTVELLSPHTAAALGKLTLLKEMEKKDPKALLDSDANGWRPIHEAARSGKKEVLVYLVETVGADVNERTNDGRGATALFWAEQMLDKDHEAIQYLKAKGAKNLAPRSGKSSSEL